MSMTFEQWEKAYRTTYKDEVAVDKLRIELYKRSMVRKTAVGVFLRDRKPLDERRDEILAERRRLERLARIMGW